jgi:DNA-binding beta-propeller fold protein YncE
MTQPVRWFVVVAALLCASPLFAQANKATAQNVPEIAVEAVPNFLKLPPGMFLGESMGVAENSKGHVFVYDRSADPRLLEFDQNGTYVRQIGEGLYGFEFAHDVRIDAEDNIWAVDEGTNMVIKFSPAGRVLMVLGRRPEAVEGMVATANRPNLPDEKYLFRRPTDVAFDAQGNIFVTDGYNNHRVVKFDKNGRYLKQIGTNLPGKGPGQFNLPHGISADAKGNLYVSDRSNNRVVVLDNDLNYKTAFTNIGSSWTTCVSLGPHQYLFSSNSNPNGNAPGTWEISGEIYKMELDGTIVGKFGYAGKLAPGFQVVHQLDCRDPNRVLVSEIESWRVQKFILKGPAKAAAANPSSQR